MTYTYYRTYIGESGMVTQIWCDAHGWQDVTEAEQCQLCSTKQPATLKTLAARQWIELRELANWNEGRAL